MTFILLIVFILTSKKIKVLFQKHLISILLLNSSKEQYYWCTIPSRKSQDSGKKLLINFKFIMKKKG